MLSQDNSIIIPIYICTWIHAPCMTSYYIHTHITYLTTYIHTIAKVGICTSVGLQCLEGVKTVAGCQDVAPYNGDHNGNYIIK